MEIGNGSVKATFLNFLFNDFIAYIQVEYLSYVSELYCTANLILNSYFR